MAHVYRSVGGRKLDKVIALNDGVQADLEERTLAMAARAEADLLQHSSSGDAFIDIDHGDVDWYVVLSDERGQRAALSIEYGRAARIDPETGQEKAAMDGLFILHKATNLPSSRHSRIRF